MHFPVVPIRAGELLERCHLSDVTVILYPQYYGIYADATCQPTGCFQNFGPGRSVMKAPADQVMYSNTNQGMRYSN